MPHHPKFFAIITLVAVSMAPSAAGAQDSAKIRVVVPPPELGAGAKRSAQKMAVRLSWKMRGNEELEKELTPAQKDALVKYGAEKEIDQAKTSAVELALPSEHQLHYVFLHVMLGGTSAPEGARLLSEPISDGVVHLQCQIVPAPFALEGMENLVNIVSCVETYVRLDKAQETVEVKESAPIQGVKGSPQEKEEEWTVKYSVLVQKGAKLEASVSGKWAVVEAGVRGSIEMSSKETYEISGKTKRKVLIPGEAKTYKVVWLENYRTGTVRTVIDGKASSPVPFKFRDGWDMQPREVK